MLNLKSNSMRRSVKRGRNKIRAFFHLILYLVGLSKKPLALRWNITSGCPKKCHYCNNDQIAVKEPTLEEIKEIIQNVIQSKPARISLSGGEPLVSRHFSFIVKTLVENNISVIMNTSGIGIENNLEAVKMLDLVQLSLDGDEEACDAARGLGTFKKVMDTIELCKIHNIKFTFATTLSKENLSFKTIDYMLSLAKKYKTVVAFQPVKRVWGLEYLFDTSAPAPHKMQEAVKYLIKLKLNGTKEIRNSLVGLKHIENWPHFPELECTGGKMFAVIQADGNLVSCDRTDSPVEKISNLKNTKLSTAIEKIPPPTCDGCGFCGATELNYLNQLNFSILSELSKL